MVFTACSRPRDLEGFLTEDEMSQASAPIVGSRNGVRGHLEPSVEVQREHEGCLVVRSSRNNSETSSERELWKNRRRLLGNFSQELSCW